MQVTEHKRLAARKQFLNAWYEAMSRTTQAIKQYNKLVERVL